MTHHCTVILHIAGSHGAVTLVFSLAFPSCPRCWGVLGRHWRSINGSVAVVYTDSISGSYRIVPIRSAIRCWSWRPFHPTRVDRQIKRHACRSRTFPREAPAGHVSTWSTYNEFHYGNTELRSRSNGTAISGRQVFVAVCVFTWPATCFRVL